MKHLTNLGLFLLLIFFAQSHLIAQQSSKSKATNKLYEKGGVELTNTTKINSTNLDFSPAFYQNGIVYVSSRYNDGERDERINETYFELFFAELDGNKQPLKPREFSININSHLHEGPVTFNRDATRMYFTRNNMKKGLQKADEQKVTRLKIYEARRGPNEWTQIVELPFSSNEYSVAHPSLTADGKRLYFTSDMPGGYGGTDLWFVDRKGEEEWSAPVNMGPDVNTPQDEKFPFIHSSGNLFFASNGYGGAGGLDLFMIDVSTNKWGEVTSLGEPFNSPADDLGLILSPSGQWGFFASARDGGVGKDDIYYFRANEGVWGRTMPKTLRSRITVLDRASEERISDAEIRVFERTEDGFLDGDNNLYEAVLMPVSEGSSELVFKLIRKDSEELGPVDEVTDANGEVVYDFMGESRYLILVAKDGFEKAEVVHSTIGNTSEPIMTIKLDKRKECAELTGFVKDQATDQAVANAIVSIINNCNGAEEIIRSDDKGGYRFCVAPGCAYTINGIKEKYEKGTAMLPKVEGTASLNLNVSLPPVTAKESKPSAISTASLEKGSVIVLENIFYDFNKSFIREGFARELDELVAVMKKYPKMTIELSAHTDSRGESSYNQKLSEERAQSAKQYLVNRGVPAYRITAIGYGEKKLRNHCKDGVECSEEEHQFNRRTEVKVVNPDTDVDVLYKGNRSTIID